ncbi:MAG: hypothetical protein JRN39_03600 [Nitrososphaerota archaeon]|nr:hypothetical protein [Nitrososphaerota archaeon]MDG6939468.1 hypothetical protein [Nitrososphaerota archaeon]
MKDARGGPVFRGLSSLNDLGRLACAFERVPRPIFGIETKGGHLLAVHTEQLAESPVFFYAKSDKIGHFLKYRIDGEVEEVSFCDEASDARYLYSPILHIRSLPENFKAAMGEAESVSSLAQKMELTDVTGLLKLSPYRMLVDEAPAPLYVSKVDGMSYIGIFVHIGENDGSDLYFYVKLDSEPTKNFIRYNPQKPVDWSYTNRTGEHASYYAKVVRLAEGLA